MRPCALFSPQRIWYTSPSQYKQHHDHLSLFRILLADSYHRFLIDLDTNPTGLLITKAIEVRASFPLRSHLLPVLPDNFY